MNADVHHGQGAGPREPAGPAVTSGFDAATPNMARICDYWLGGKDHVPADRDEAGRLLRIYPRLRDLARENKAFLAQAISWAAGQGTGQFLDLAAGLPTLQNTHQVAQAVNPAAAVAYVDTDPVVLAHARARLVTSRGVAAVARTCATGSRAGEPGAAPSSTRPGRWPSSSARSCTSWTPIPPGR